MENIDSLVRLLNLRCSSIFSFQFRDEIEFIWRFARAYGDMYELSTNTQEKKYYANIGKYFVKIEYLQVIIFIYK